MIENYTKKTQIFCFICFFRYYYLQNKKIFFY